MLYCFFIIKVEISCHRCQCAGKINGSTQKYSKLGTQGANSPDFLPRLHSKCRVGVGRKAEKM